MNAADEPEPDHYRTLGVPPGAGLPAIQEAYARRASSLRSELGHDQVALREAFRRLNDAYSVLGAPGRRLEYDRSLGLEPVQPPVIRTEPAPPPLRPIGDRWVMRSEPEGRGCWPGCIAITAGLVAVVCVGAIWFAVQCKRATDEADRIVGEFLAALAHRDYEQAYSWFCNETKRDLPYEEFRASFSDMSWMFQKYKDHETAASELTYSSSAPRVLRYEAIVSFSDGTQALMDVTFIQEDGHWCMQDGEFSYPGGPPQGPPNEPPLLRPVEEPPGARRLVGAVSRQGPRATPSARRTAAPGGGGHRPARP